MWGLFVRDFKSNDCCSFLKGHLTVPMQDRFISIINKNMGNARRGPLGEKTICPAPFKRTDPDRTQTRTDTGGLKGENSKTNPPSLYLSLDMRNKWAK